MIKAMLNRIADIIHQFGCKISDALDDLSWRIRPQEPEEESEKHTASIQEGLGQGIFYFADKYNISELDDATRRATQEFYLAFTEIERRLKNEQNKGPNSKAWEHLKRNQLYLFEQSYSRACDACHGFLLAVAATGDFLIMQDKA